jgi:outer membrane biosynthesis protein TonB
MKERKDMLSKLKPTVPAIALSLFFGASILAGSQVDPLYLQLLKDGESSFQAKDYRGAVKELELAAFGLYRDKKLAAKAYSLLALSYYYLKDLSGSQNHLTTAANLIGPEGLAGLDFSPEAEADLTKLLVEFKMAAPSKAEAAKPSGKQPQTSTSLSKTIETKKEEMKPETEHPAEKKVPPAKTEEPKKEDAQSIEVLKAGVKNPEEELQERIRLNPDDTASYYELFELYKKDNRRAAARTTLLSLVEENFAEFTAFYELGKIAYEEKKYAEAWSRFNEVLKLAKLIQVGDEILDASRAYLILCSFLLGDETQARNLAQESADIFHPDKMSSLPLDENDKKMLQRILSRMRQDVLQEGGVLSDILIRPGSDSLEVDILFSPYIAHRVFEIPEENKVVIDIPGMAVNNADRSQAVNSFGVKAIRTAMFTEETARVVLDLEGPFPSYQVKRTDFGLRVTIRKNP